ncbi:MAG TPA: hypothetical protein DCM28_10725 [Phycisphaerales bacterium]|nr:hypothetical protein [Phycisphaerales bacterium]HCD31353.1 hypothetical protein [Phycisphaerales bacterium]|tara:strand:+ start:782 stop:1504 length:723 start_codon:yes stop_codon:yes gene_type:complete
MRHLTTHATNPSLGTFCTLGVDAMEILGQGIFGHLILDAQHGQWSIESLRHAIRAASIIGTKVTIRLPVRGHWMIESLLDAGCESLLIPMVNTSQQAIEAVRACYYPPMGIRSQSSCRASLLNGSDDRKTFNDRFELLVMIEHIDAMEQLQQIVELQGITGCFIGPTDLTSSLEHANKSIEFEQVVVQIYSLCKTYDKKVCITAPDMPKAKARLKQEFDLVMVSTDRKMLMLAVNTMQVQ